MAHRCYNFEPSGHCYQPLDGWREGTADLVARLYCTRCGRISVATTENNIRGWQFDILPPEAQADYLSNLSPRKSDA